MITVEKIAKAAEDLAKTITKLQAMRANLKVLKTLEGEQARELAQLLNTPEVTQEIVNELLVKSEPVSSAISRALTLCWEMIKGDDSDRPAAWVDYFAETKSEAVKVKKEE